MARRQVSTTGGTLVLDSEGLSKLAAGDQRTRAHLESARERGAGVVVSAITLAEGRKCCMAVRATPSFIGCCHESP